MDDEGYVQSFLATETEAVQSFFSTYGFVVIRDALSSEQVDATLEEFFSRIDGGREASDEKLCEFFAAQPFGFAGIIGAAADLSQTQVSRRVGWLVVCLFSFFFFFFFFFFFSSSHLTHVPSYPTDAVH